MSEKEIEAVAWICTKQTNCEGVTFQEPFVATNPAYVDAHPHHDWRPLAYAEELRYLRLAVREMSWGLAEEQKRATDAERRYQQLREAVDGGSESMTHDEAVRWAEDAHDTEGRITLLARSYLGENERRDGAGLAEDVLAILAEREP